MMQYVLLAWILGMTGMGKVWSLTTVTCVMFVIFWMMIQLLVVKCPNFKPQLFRFFSIIFLCLFSFNLAYLYADAALTQRMDLRESTTKQAEVIVHVKSMNQIQSNRIKQPVKWLAYLQPSSDQSLELG